MLLKSATHACFMCCMQYGAGQKGGKVRGGEMKRKRSLIVEWKGIEGNIIKDASLTTSTLLLI